VCEREREREKEREGRERERERELIDEEDIACLAVLGVFACVCVRERD